MLPLISPSPPPLPHPLICFKFCCVCCMLGNENGCFRSLLTVFVGQAFQGLQTVVFVFLCSPRPFLDQRPNTLKAVSLALCPETFPLNVAWFCMCMGNSLPACVLKSDSLLRIEISILGYLKLRFSNLFCYPLILEKEASPNQKACIMLVGESVIP